MSTLSYATLLRTSLARASTALAGTSCTPLNSTQFAAEVLTDRPHDRLHAVQVDGGEHRMPVLRHENQVGVQRKYAVAACTNVPILSHGPSTLVGMRLRYRYRLDPDPAQRWALAKAFGCARVVYNDGLRAREDAYKAGRPYLSDGRTVTSAHRGEGHS